MHVLLPPSETKRAGGDTPFLARSLAHHRALGTTRTAVRRALEALSRDEDAAARALHLGVKSRGEIAHNLVLATSGAMPAIDRYTGVLYDALAASDLDRAARDWLLTHVSVQSALFGLVGAGDAIPAYRLSAGSRLPVDGRTLKATWVAAHAGLDWASLGWILDLRSKDYAALAPLPAGRGVTLQVASRGTDGTVAALNHFNKAAKGALVRELARTRPAIDDAASLIAWATSRDLELSATAESELTLITPPGGLLTAR